MTEVLGVLVGVVGMVVALFLFALLAAFAWGVAKGARGAGWSGALVAVVLLAWAAATTLLLASLPVLLGAWIADAPRTTAVAGELFAHCFWPALLGLPLAWWLGGIVRRRTDGTG